MGYVRAVEDGSVIACWVSCGAPSAVAAKLAVEEYGERCDVRLVNNPVLEEDPDNRRFLDDMSSWIGKPVEIVRNSKWPENSADVVWRASKGMSFKGGAPCTTELKKGARLEWEIKNKPDWHVLGFTEEERGRARGFMLTERSTLLPILIEHGLTRQDCADILIKAGLKLPRIYHEGYPNANCIGCVKAGSATYWNLVRRTRPEVFRARAKLSRKLGAKLVYYKGKRIFLDELPPDAKGHPIKELNFDCGLFCEEQIPSGKVSVSGD